MGSKARLLPTTGATLQPGRRCPDLVIAPGDIQMVEGLFSHVSFVLACIAMDGHTHETSDWLPTWPEVPHRRYDSEDAVFL